MKDAIGQEIKLGDVIIFTKDFSGYSVGNTITFATKFGSTNKIGTTQAPRFMGDSAADYVSYADSKNVIVFTEQAIKFYGSEFVENMRSKVTLHEEQVKVKAPSTRYFVIIEKDYSAPKVTYDSFLEANVFVIQVEGRNKKDFFRELNKKIPMLTNFTNIDCVILEKKGNNASSFDKVPVKYRFDAPYSLAKLKTFGLDKCIDKKVPPECLHTIRFHYNNEG